METGERQAAQTAQIFGRHGLLLPRTARSDDWGATVIVGTRPTAPRTRS